jgi:hypothetical protein
MADTMKPTANAAEVAERIVEEIVARLRDELRPLVREAVSEAVARPTQTAAPQLSPLDLPTLSVGPWPEGLQLLSREEYYVDVDR